MVEFISIRSGTKGPLPGTLDLMIEVKTDDDAREVWPFHYVPADKEPVTLAVAAWLQANPKFAFGPWPKPSTDPNDYRLNRKQVRMAFIRLGLPADAIDIALNNSSKGAEREMMRLDWLEDSVFDRLAPVVIETFAFYAQVDPTLTESKLDAAWLDAARL